MQPMSNTVSIEDLCRHYCDLTAMLRETDRALDKLDKQLRQGKISLSTFIKFEHHHLTYVQKASYERDCIKQEILHRCS